MFPRKPRRDSLNAGQRWGSAGRTIPFAVLGPTLGDGWVVRAWMPEASSVGLLLERPQPAHGHAPPPLVV